MNCLESISARNVCLNLQGLANSFEDLSKRIYSFTSSLFLDLGIIFIYAPIFGINPSFHCSIQSNTWFSPSVLLFFGANVNAADQHGRTPLQIACAERDTETIRLLINSGADVNPVTENRDPPLLTACKHLATEIARLLIKSGADVNRQDKQGRTPLQIACAERDTETIRLLINSGADVNPVTENRDPPLFLACKYGATEIARLLINSGADITTTNSSGITPLSYASFYGHTEITRLLINSGADVNPVTKHCGSPLFTACVERDTETARLLINSGADLTPILNEKEIKLLNFLKEVINNPATKGMDQKERLTAFLKASISPSSEVCKNLFKLGNFDINLVAKPTSYNRLEGQSIFAFLPNGFLVNGEFLSKDEAIRRVDEAIQGCN